MAILFAMKRMIGFTRIIALSTVAFLMTFTQVNGQKTEVGGILGLSYYWGDIVNDFQPATMKPGGSFFIRYHMDPRLALRASLSYAKLGGEDAASKNSEFQRRRNLSFETNVIELAAVAEFNLIPDKNKGRRLRTFLVPYVYGGLGVFYFDPTAVNPITGQEVRLRPLKLEGTSYSPIAMCIPLGVGTRFYLTRNWQIGFDLGMRYSLSSHIDDVDGQSTYPMPEELTSDDQRIMYNPDPVRIALIRETGSTEVWGRNGKPRGKNELISDVYFIYGVSLSYRIWPKGARSYGGRAIRCPRFY